MQSLNEDAVRYYRLTEEEYRLLARETTPFMNLGLWPAPSVVQAQERLAEELVRYAQPWIQARNHAPLSLMEGGSGWGGSRAVLAGFFPEARYCGINCSARQIAYAERLNQYYPQTRYVHGFMEELPRLGLPAADAFFALESVLHVRDKEQLLADLASLRIPVLALAEICLEDKNILDRYSLFNPSLRYTWSQADYERALSRSAYHDFEMQDLSGSVFAGWSEYLDSIEATEFQGRKKILEQFKASYAALAELAEAGQVRYLLIRARKDR